MSRPPPNIITSGQIVNNWGDVYNDIGEPIKFNYIKCNWPKGPIRYGDGFPPCIAISHVFATKTVPEGPLAMCACKLDRVLGIAPWLCGVSWDSSWVSCCCLIYSDLFYGQLYLYKMVFISCLKCLLREL